MNTSNFQKIVHIPIWIDGKILLSQVLKASYHKGYWSDPGGKVEKNENLHEAAERELWEEVGLAVYPYEFTIVDCFIYPSRKIKAFLFETDTCGFDFSEIENKEPKKHSPWQLFTKKEALKLKLMPSVRNYLKNKKI